MTRYLPISKVAERWGRTVDHVRAHIDAGHLRAVDTSVTGSRKEYVVLLADVEQFEQSRSSAKPMIHKAVPKAKRSHLI